MIPTGPAAAAGDSLTPHFAHAPIRAIVQQHVDDAAHLRHVRSVLVRAPHVRLLHLGRLDERIAAHLDGIAIAGVYGTALCHEVLDPPSTGAVFAAAVQAIGSHDAERLSGLIALAGAVPECRAGLYSAFGWVSASALRGITRSLLESADPWHREVGLMACALHRVDPAAALTAAVHDADPAVRDRALRIAGPLARSDLRTACVAAIADEPVERTGPAAVSALLLGDRGVAIDALMRLAAEAPAWRMAALGLLLKVLPLERCRAIQRAIADDANETRTSIRAAGIAGDPRDVPWLISLMDQLPHARLAGEAFSMIAGLDLAYLDLELKPPKDVPFGPNDDPDDANVAMDEDDSLPWPDPVKIAAWWKTNGARHTPGVRHFMGKPPSVEHAVDVLKTGFQRQRAAAAQYLCLLKPGTPLFNVCAPTRRQQRLLAQMGD